MIRNPTYDPAVVSAGLAYAIALTGTQQKLAAACGVTQASISRARLTGRISPQFAIAIHRVTDGAVPASALRPDLWRKAGDVPVESFVVSALAPSPGPEEPAS